jgi:hypothetical protein
MGNDNTEDEIEDVEELNDEEVTLADDILDEVSDDDTADDLLEGFGVLPIATEPEEEEEKDEDSEEEEMLEEDAEDVDFDRFDDVDEL